LAERDWAPWQAVDECVSLKGYDVEFYNGAKFLDRGRVELITADGEILWLMQDGALPRRIVEKSPDTHANCFAFLATSLAL
jgi:hypothetical protein